jgi:hypothetical protein
MKAYDMYKKIADAEQVERHQVKSLAIGIIYCVGGQGQTIQELEDRITKTVQMAKRVGVI